MVVFLYNDIADYRSRNRYKIQNKTHTGKYPAKRQFVRQTKQMMQYRRAQDIMGNVNRHRFMRGLPLIDHDEAIKIALKISNTDKMIGKVYFSAVGGVLLAPVAEGGYWWVMRNPEATMYGLEVLNDFLNSSTLPFTLPGELWFMMTHMGDNQ